MSSGLRPLAIIGLAAISLAACDDQNPAGIQSHPVDPQNYTAPAEPVDGEFIRQQFTNTVYLSYGRVLYGVPDPQTLRACTGGRDRVVREVSSLPSWPQRTLPSAGDPTRRPHGRVWMYGDRPVKTSTSGTVWVVVGCVKSGIPSEAVYNTMFNGDWSRIVTVSDADLAALPTGPAAQALPLRRAGTLLESGGTVRWVTFHGGSLGLDAASTMDSHCRAWSEMFSGTEANAYTIIGILQPGSYSCVRGNDYPYQSASMSYADPWNFYYRNCTSFAAWRLNQDGIEFHNYYGGPRWSDASNWDDVARSLGMRVDKTAKPGAIAQWNSNHVAYVAAVHNDGYITIEDYNAGYPTNPGLYNSRRITASSVENYIHFR